MNYNSKIGRPILYKPEMCEIAINLMKEGASKTEVAAILDISKETFYEYCKKYPDFSDAIKRGTQLSEAWWESQARFNLKNKEFSAALWYMNMKNRFGWRDKHETETRVYIKQSEALEYLK